MRICILIIVILNLLPILGQHRSLYAAKKFLLYFIIFPSLYFFTILVNFCSLNISLRLLHPPQTFLLISEAMAAILQLWQTLKEAIAAYTGLSPTAFFGALGVAVVIYHVISGFFRAPLPPIRRTSDMPQIEPLLPPVELGEISEEDLKAYDGSDPKKPLLMAIKGQIYDVSQSRYFLFILRPE